MKAAFKGLLALAVVLGVGLIAAQAEDDKDKKKEVTLKGTCGCAKCIFKLDKSFTKGKCMNAILVKKDDKEIIYVLKDKGRDEKYHGKICTAKQEGSVTGVVDKKSQKVKDSKDKEHTVMRITSKEGLKYED
jgi:hypothetical protein